MKDPLNLLKSLERPTLLVTAAQRAAHSLQRDVVLPKVLKSHAPAGHGEAVMKLVMIEEEMNEARHARAAGYSPARHVTVLAALIAEGRALAARTRPGQAKASATSPLRLVT